MRSSHKFVVVVARDGAVALLRGLALLAILVIFTGCQASPARSLESDQARWARDSAFSDDGRLVAAALDDGSVKVWERNSGRLVRSIKGFDPAAVVFTQRVAFAPGGANMIAFAGTGGAAVLADITKSEADAPPRAMRGHDRPVHHLAFTSDGSRLVTVSGGMVPQSRDFKAESRTPVRVIVFDVASGNVVSRFDDDKSGAAAVAIAPDGSRVAVACATPGQEDVNAPFPKVGQVNQKILILDANSGQVLREISPVDDASLLIDYSTDGQLLYCGKGVWNALTGKRVSRLPETARCFVGRDRLLGFGGGKYEWEERAGQDWIQPYYINARGGGSDVRTASRVPEPEPIFGNGRRALSPDFHVYIDRKSRLWRLPQ
jgi:hypothetical protein